MDFDITLVRKLTPLRNSKAAPFEVREHLNIVLGLAELINKEPPGEYRDELIEQFKRTWAEVIPKLAALGINV